MGSIDLDALSVEEMEALENQLKEKKVAKRETNKKAYEELKDGFMSKLRNRVYAESDQIESFANYVKNETSGFFDIMKEYGQLKTSKQMSYKLIKGDFKLEVKFNKVKKFDERADIAAEKLIDFLRSYIKGKEMGADDPLYQLAMTLIERNREGDLDYKQISKLYQLESKFKNKEYSEIMQLFKESHVIEETSTHYYFSKRGENKVWKKIEISFNRF